MGESNEQPDQEEIQSLRDEVASLQEKLTEEHKMAALGRLSASIVHEVNTPIGSIFSNTEVLHKSVEKVRTLLKDAQCPPRALDLLETMGSLIAIDRIACERISSIVKSMKTFARAGGDQDIHKANLNEIIQSTLKLSSPLYRRHVVVVTEFGELPSIECYPGLLAQVFLNLIVNAAQAIEGDGKITVQTRLEGDMVHVSIADTGKGIAPEHQTKLFRTGFTTKPVGEGTGLGLAITREIVEDAHKGSISFESTVGVGTTFHVRLPLVQPQPQQSDAASI